MAVPAVLLHGYTDSASSFELLVTELPEWLEPYPLTHREHGDATEVAAFMDAAGLEQAVVLGHSAGSYTAQRFAVDYPERTLGVVLLGAARSWARHPVIMELWEAVAELGDPVDRGFAAEFQLSTMERPVPVEFVEMVIGESQALPAAVWKWSLRQLIDAPVPTEVGPLDAPALMVWGERDGIVSRADADEVLAAIPGAELAVYEGTGHAPHWEQPARAAADIAAFVSSRGLRRPRSVVAR